MIPLVAEPAGFFFEAVPAMRCNLFVRFYNRGSRCQQKGFSLLSGLTPLLANPSRNFIKNLVDFCRNRKFIIQIPIENRD